MSDILIKDMKMPKDTGSITVTIYSDGSTGIWTEQDMIAGGMAIELPPHGRLIEADALEKILLDAIKEAPTSIDADGKMPPHGRLIDADALQAIYEAEERKGSAMMATDDVIDDIVYAPTVLEANR